MSGKADGEAFTSVHALDIWDSLEIDLTTTTSTSSNLKPHVQVTGTPGTHVPPGFLSVANNILGAVPPTNGWIVELGYTSSNSSTPFHPGYRIYISGDTLMFDDIHRIPELYSSATGKPIDLMLIHLGGTTIPSPSMPLLMVTMDAKMGIELMRIVGGPSLDNDIVTVPIHFE